MADESPRMLTEEEGNKVKADFAVKRLLQKKEAAQQKIKDLVEAKEKVDPTVAAAAVQQMVIDKNKLPKAEIEQNLPEATTAPVAPKPINQPAPEPEAAQPEPEVAQEPTPEELGPSGPSEITNHVLTEGPSEITNHVLTEQEIEAHITAVYKLGGSLDQLVEVYGENLVKAVCDKIEAEKKESQ